MDVKPFQDLQPGECALYTSDTITHELMEMPLFIIEMDSNIIFEVYEDGRYIYTDGNKLFIEFGF